MLLKLHDFRRSAGPIENCEESGNHTKLLENIPHNLFFKDRNLWSIVLHFKIWDKTTVTKSLTWSTYFCFQTIWKIYYRCFNSAWSRFYTIDYPNCPIKTSIVSHSLTQLMEIRHALNLKPVSVKCDPFKMLFEVNLSTSNDYQTFHQTLSHSNRLISNLAINYTSLIPNESVESNRRYCEANALLVIAWDKDNDCLLSSSRYDK